MKQAAIVAGKVFAGFVLIAMVAFGFHVVHHGANARWHGYSQARRDERETWIKSLQKSKLEILRRADNEVRTAKAGWGGPERVNVIKRGAMSNINGVLYTTTDLEVIDQGLTIQRLVPTEITDRSPFKFWWCNNNYPKCNPGIGFSTTIDDSRKPWEQEVNRILFQRDNDIKKLPAVEEFERTHTVDQRPASLWGAAFHYGFIIWWTAMMLAISFIAYPRWRKGFVENILLL